MGSEMCIRDRYTRQCLTRMERLVNSEQEGSSAVDYARIALQDLKSEYQKVLVENIEVATEEAKAIFNQMLIDVGLAVPYPRSSINAEDVAIEEPPSLEELNETDTEYEEEEKSDRLGSFSATVKNNVLQYSGKGEERKLDGTIVQERIDGELLEDLIETLKDVVIEPTRQLALQEDLSLIHISEPTRRTLSRMPSSA